MAAHVQGRVVRPAVMGPVALRAVMTLVTSAHQLLVPVNRNRSHLPGLLHVSAVQALVQNFALVVKVARVGLRRLGRVRVAQLNLVLL